ncbi:carboxypeptidase-like regulatory domain-containing protein [uncultured Weeksella sp.]|uniref:carboxypeptidase-like regulatory domain-containing protein n=1 Tax=uncultured Weeksella sp. TaxID=1161389 RepID=UPI00259B9CDF|nr:carboxypeptidase-like regulatory domain-containing protein [uncultured Weeksella sp.]
MVNVQVLVNSSSRTTKTDNKGFFRIDFPNGQHNLIFRHDYFQTKILNLQSNQTLMLEVVMEEDIIYPIINS